MNVSNVHIRTTTFTCDDNYLFDGALRSQEQDVNITTHSLAHPLPTSTWTTLNSPRDRPVTQTMRGAYTTCLRQSHLRDQRWTVYPHSGILLHLFVSLFPSTPSASISSHFPSTAAFLLYYFDESLTVPLPHHSPSPSTPPFLMTTFASLPSFIAHPHQHIQRHVCAWPGIIITFVMSSYYSLF